VENPEKDEKTRKTACGKKSFLRGTVMHIVPDKKGVDKKAPNLRTSVHRKTGYFHNFSLMDSTM